MAPGSFAMNLGQSGDLAQLSGGRREHRTADHEREHEHQSERTLEAIDRAPQRIAVNSDRSANSPDQRHFRNSARAPAPRPSHQESIPSARWFSPLTPPMFGRGPAWPRQNSGFVHS